MAAQPWHHSDRALARRPSLPHLFHARATDKVRSNVSWLDIDIREPTNVLRLSKHPLLTPGPLGCFDDSGAIGCWIVEHDGIEHLYYQGWNRGVTVGFYVAVGLAVRPAGDPDRPFERISDGTDPRSLYARSRSLSPTPR